MGLFIAVQWQEGQRIITVVPTDMFLLLSIRLCASVCTAGYHVVRKTGCFSSSLDGGLSWGWSSKQRRATSRNPGDKCDGIDGAVVALAICGRNTRLKRSMRDSWPRSAGHGVRGLCTCALHMEGQTRGNTLLTVWGRNSPLDGRIFLRILQTLGH